MTHPAKPEDHDHLRSVLDRLKSDSWDGWHGNDRPFVDCEGKELEEALQELSRRTEERLEEHKERQRFTKPSRKRREARQSAQHRIQRGDTTW
ncbi:ribosomal protein S21 [Salinibacter ruber]|uniref:bS21 family ribosomal protein n=1 Tax=Salinibacter ruber TaxID=146919 RepID=UPI002166F33A|nr:bS21 family ribosomal protein [Salinibacter ruber]MCS4139587.1 ribosomal protein S21 [Salinibacter ruber]